MDFKGVDINVALYIVAILAIYMLLGRPAREGMESADPEEADDDDQTVQETAGAAKRIVYGSVQELAAAVKAFVESQTRSDLKAEIMTTKRSKKKGWNVRVRIRDAQGIKFRGWLSVDSSDALKSARNMLRKMFASPQLAARVDLAGKDFKKSAMSYDTVAALTQGATTALAGAKAQGFKSATIMANKKWDGAADFVHVIVYGRKPGEKKPTFVFRGYSRLDNDATLLAAYQAMQQTLQGLRDAKFKPFLIGNRLVVATSPRAAAVIATTVAPTLAPTSTPVASVPPTVSLPPMGSNDPLATLPPLVTAVPVEA